MKKLFVFALASLFILSACGKKADEAPAPKSSESVPAQEVKANDAQEAKPTEAAPKANAPEQAPANEEKPAEAAPEPEKPAQADDNHTDLALTNACVVTHCKEFTGFENNGLACDTDNIVNAGFAFGDTVYRVGFFVHDNACNPQGEEWDACFLQKQALDNYIKDKKLDCESRTDKECLYESEDWCK